MKWICRIILPVLFSFLLPGCPGHEEDTSYFDQAEYYFSRGQFSQAGTLYRQYIDTGHDSKRYEAWNRLFSIRVDIYGDVQGGLDILKAMQMEFDEKKDRVLDINVRIAGLYDRLGQPRDSYRVWKKNRELADSVSDKKEAALNMSRAAAKLREFGRVRDALQEFRDCVGEIDADLCSRIHYTLGKSYYLETDLVLARESLTKAYSRDAQNEYRSRAGLLLVEVLLDLDEIDQARAILKELLDIHPNPGAIEVRLNNLTFIED